MFALNPVVPQGTRGPLPCHSQAVEGTWMCIVTRWRRSWRAKTTPSRGILHPQLFLLEVKATQYVYLGIAV